MSPIHTEEDFQQILATQKTATDISMSEKYIQLETLVKDMLAKQDSEKALTILTRGALALGSSDIHYDTTEADILVRIRIDGDLCTIFRLAKKDYKLLLERLKYKSDLKLNIVDTPQDGKYRITDDGERIDVRISTLPVKYGENTVCRILDSTKNIPTLEELGFIWISKRQIEKSLKKKNGTILVTGPTGSGKTTTLYSMLTHLNTPDKKIITLEDPIEYELPGVVQSEVSEKTNYTYVNGLRALMRQDPDILMIGEIRDIESATISLQAAMTGHLVLSTLHTKSASETIERLMNMGLPAYILASGLDVIIAQRLVRRLCPHCKTAYTADAGEKDIIEYMMKDIGMAGIKKDTYTLYRATGCEKCAHTGYHGRVGIYEVLSFSDHMRKAVRDGASPGEIMSLARENDLVLMREDGILKAMKGYTSLDELFRVIE